MRAVDLIERRLAEINVDCTAPRRLAISASAAFLAALITEFEELGGNVHRAGYLYSFECSDGTRAVKLDAKLSGITFLIQKEGHTER